MGHTELLATVEAVAGQDLIWMWARLISRFYGDDEVVVHIAHAFRRLCVGESQILAYISGFFKSICTISSGVRENIVRKPSSG